MCTHLHAFMYVCVCVCLRSLTLRPCYQHSVSPTRLSRAAR